MSDGSIVIDTAIDTDGLKTGLSTINSSLKRLGNNMSNTFNSARINSGISTMTASLMKLAGIVGVAFSVKALIDFSKESIEIASDIKEVDNVVAKAFGNMRGEMDELANSAIKTLGMSRLTAYQTGSTFMSMGKSMLDSAEDAKTMAIELTKLTANMSSFYNKSQDLVSIALKSIYTGETETLKQYGIVMTEVNLKQFALEQGITKAYSAMTQSEKVMLRYNYVMQQTSFIGDDFADTVDSWANQTRILKEQWKEFMSIVGDALISVLTPLIKHMNQIVSSLITMATALTDVLAKMGIVIQSTTDASTSTADASDSMDDYGDSISSASAKAKKALGTFDDLNTLTSNAGSGSGSSGSSSGLNIDVEQTVKSSNEVTEAIENMFGSWEELGKLASTNLEKVLKKIPWDEIEKKFRGLGESVADFVNGFTSNLGSAEQIGKSIAGMLNSAVNLVYGYVNKLDWEQVGKWLGTLVKNGVLDFEWELLGETIALRLNGISTAISGFFEEFKTADLTDGISTTLNTAIEDVEPEVVGSAISTVLWNGFDLVEGIFEKTHLTDAVNKIIDTVKKVFTTVQENQTLGQKFGSTIATIMNKGFDLVINGNVDELISSIAQFLFETFDTAISNIDAKALEQALEKILIDLPMNVANSLAREITITLLSPFLSEEDIANMREKMATAQKTAESFTHDMQEVLGVSTDNMTKGEQYTKAYNDALTELTRNMTLYNKEGLTKLQEKYGLANDAMDRIISYTDMFASSTQKAKSGLDDYNGNWAEFTKQVEKASEQQEKLYYNTDRMDKVFNNTTKAVKESKDGTEDLNKAVKEYIKIGDSLDSGSGLSNELADVKEKTEGVSIAFDGLNEETQKSLDEITKNVNTWFEDTIKPVFSKKTWTEFGENINGAMSGAIETFMGKWSTSFDDWNDTNIDKYFGYETWDKMIDDNILTAYRDNQEIFSDEWQENMYEWQSEFVEPYFDIKVWESYGLNMKNGILSGFKAIVSEIGGLMNRITDMFNQQLSNIVSSVNSLISSINSSGSALNLSSISSVSYNQIPRVNIPALATGAVLPANKPFMALVGDQKNGTNIEAPLNTIVEAFNTALNSRSDTQILKDILEVLINKETGIREDDIFNSVQKSARKYSQATGRFAF